MVDANLILGPRIQVPCEAAPQEGVHVYHFPFSSCSQMVRFALCAKEFQAWESHDIDIFSAMAHLEPEYARINPRCVVPSLVVDGKVTTETKAIIDEIDKLPGGRLMPADPAEAETVKRFLDMTSKIQLQVITFGSLPGLDPASDPAAKKVDGVAKRRTELVSGHLATNSDDAFLKSVYEAKLQALSIIKDSLSSPETAKGAAEGAVAFLDEVEAQLKKGASFSKGGWLASMELSAADIICSVIINRFAWKGMAAAWLEPRPNIMAYMLKIKEHPAWKEGVAKYLS